MLVVVSNTSGRTDLVGMLVMGSTGAVYSPSAKAFVTAPEDGYLPLVEFAAPVPSGEYRWLDANVPMIPSNDECLFYAMSKSTANPPVYTKIGEPLTIAPFLPPTGIVFASVFSPFFGR